MGKKKIVLTERVGSVWIRKRPDKSPYWSLRWMEGAREKEKSLRVTNKEVARAKAQEYSDLIERGDMEQLASRQAAHTTLFQELVAEFLESYGGWAASTKEKNKGALDKMVEEWGHLPLAQLTSRRIDAYLARRINEGLAPGTANRYLAALKSLMKCAINWGYLRFNPTERLTFRPEQARIPEALTPAQANALLATLQPFARDLSLIALDSGLRASEIRALVWGDIDFEAGTLTVRKSKNHSARVVPLTGRLKALLVDLKANSDGKDTTYVYPFDNIKKSLYRAGEEVGVGVMHFHRFRHTYITWLLEAGVPINEVQYLAGHKDIRMTQRYDHPTMQRHRSATDALEAYHRQQEEEEED